MKKTFVLSCCSTADLPKEYAKERNINVVPFHYYLNGKEYRDTKSGNAGDFYKALKNGASVSTSQVNAAEFTEIFTPYLEKGLDILHVCLSGGLSGVYNSARAAANELKERFPERKILVVDSLSASSGYGLLVSMLADMRDEGKSIDELYLWAQKNKLKINHWFFSTDLSFYVRGGRISRAAGWFGTALKICPLLNMDGAGKLVPRQKVRTKHAVMIETVNKMKENAEKGSGYTGKCFICHSDCYADAALLASIIENEFPSLDGNVEITDIGPTIGSHTGPGTVAVFFFGKSRAESAAQMTEELADGRASAV